MKIISVKTVVYEEIETDDEFPVYRRYPDGEWENLMGESWEPVFFSSSLEQAYLKYKEVFRVLYEN